MRCGRWVSKQTEGDLLHCTNWLRCRGSCELCENERKQWLPGSPWCSAHDSSLIIAIVCERFAHVFPFRYYFCQPRTSSLTMPNTFHRLNLLVQKTFNLIINSHEKTSQLAFPLLWLHLPSDPEWSGGFTDASTESTFYDQQWINSEFWLKFNKLLHLL